MKKADKINKRHKCEECNKKADYVCNDWCGSFYCKKHASGYDFYCPNHEEPRLVEI